MRLTNLASVVLLGFFVWVPSSIAQEPTAGGTYRGMFGPRTLGQPFSPRPRHFGGGLRVGPSGDFLGVRRPQGESAPWRQAEPAGLPWIPTPVVVVPSEPIPGPAAALPSAAPAQPQPQPPASIWFRSGTR